MPGHTVARSAARGAIASMAMSGLRRVTTALGWLERTPPEAILADRAPKLFRRVPVEQRVVLVEVAHLSYGTLGGVAFGLLPERLRRSDWVGPAFGALLWLGYAAVIGPMLGLSPARKPGRGVQWLVLLVDHLLYGVVVAASPWPYRD